MISSWSLHGFSKITPPAARSASWKSWILLNLQIPQKMWFEIDKIAFFLTHIFLQLRLSLLASLGHSLQLQKGTQMPLEPCFPLSSNYPASHIRIPVNKAEIAKGSAKFESFSSGPRDSDGQWEFALHRLYINLWKVRTCLQYLAMSSRLCSMTARHPRPHQKIHKK